MLLPPSAFTHVPELAGKITPPEDSRFRDMPARIAGWDDFAARTGMPPTWRHSHEHREALRRQALAGRMDRDLWVFAYGGVMTDPGFHAVEIRRARVLGWHRCFRLLVEMGRGTPENPCLQGTLDTGGTCDGLAFRIPAEHVDHETHILCARELIGAGYLATILPATTPQGDIEALAFVADPQSHRYARLDEPETVRIIATAAGPVGPNREYLDNIVTQLAHLDISDPQTERLATLCAAYRPS